VKVKNKQARKTVGITLLLSLLVEAKNRNLNISRIIEQALLSILEYYPRQNKSEIPNSACGSSDFLSSGSFLKENDWCRGPGLNPRQMEISPANPSFFCFVMIFGFFGFGAHCMLCLALTCPRHNDSPRARATTTSFFSRL
jgi:hypothetical protein